MNCELQDFSLQNWLVDRW